MAVQGGTKAVAGADGSLAHATSGPNRKKTLATTIAAAEAKTKFLQMLSSVEEAGEYVITKRGKPVAKLIAYSEKDRPSIYGCMRGTGRIIGDVISPLPPEEWGDLY